MKRSTTSSSRFRPSLEALEGRELPSTAGILLFIAGQTVQQADQKVQADNTKLQADVNTQKNSPLGSNFQALAATTNADRAQLQTDFTALKNANQQAQGLELFAFLSGGFDQTDVFFLFTSLGSINQGTSDAQSVPGQVTSLGNQTFMFFPTTTINQSEMAFGFPALSLS
jgi:hypothetical protein